jgi:hypothetical protein
MRPRHRSALVDHKLREQRTIAEAAGQDRMFGIPDYTVPVAVADQAANEAFCVNRMAELPGLAGVNSQFTMKIVKRGGALPN